VSWGDASSRGRANIDSRPAPPRAPNSLKLRAIMADPVFAHYAEPIPRTMRKPQRPRDENPNYFSYDEY
jgi:hypothetical protein